MASLFYENLKFRSSENFISFLVYSVPKSWNTLHAVIKHLKTIDLNFYDVNFLPTSVVDLKNSCHICLREYKDLHNYQNCVIINFYNDSYPADLISEILKLDNNIITKLICQAKVNKDLICPRLKEHKEMERNIESSLQNVVESWFSDEEIFKHKDILVAMNNHGWVPMTVLVAKLQDSIIISNDVLVTKLSQTSLLVIDETKKYVRRVVPKLPISKEFCQILLLDIPDTVKSIRQLPALLKIEGSKVESFDYGTHSALLTVCTREEAEKIVAQSIETLKMASRLLVPNITDDNDAKAPDNDIEQNQLHKMLQNLTHSDCVQEDVHVSRLNPSELTYEFAEDFVKPNENLLARIVKQCNFYFSDENVLKDLFILKKIKSNSGGWIDTLTVANFKMMVNLSGNSVDTVVYAMCFSDQVQISPDGMSLRRRLPLPEWDASIYTRSLFLWRLPVTCQSFQDLDRVFKTEGRFPIKVSRFIRAHRNIPADLKKLTDKIPSLGHEDCGVVEFVSRETMLSADAYIRMKWPSVQSFYLDTKMELPKPAVIVGKQSAKCLPPPIPIADSVITSEYEVSSFQAGTRIDPRFWQAAQTFIAKRREEHKLHQTGAPSPKIASHKEFPSLADSMLKDKTNVRRGPAADTVKGGKKVKGSAFMWKKRGPGNKNGAGNKAKVVNGAGDKAKVVNGAGDGCIKEHHAKENAPME